MSVSPDPMVTSPKRHPHAALRAECRLELEGRAFGVMRQTIGGERHLSGWRGNAAARSLSDAPSTPLEDGLGKVDLLFLSGIRLATLPPAGRQRLFGVMPRLHGRGARVAFDNHDRPRLWPDRAALIPADAMADLLAGLTAPQSA